MLEDPHRPRLATGDGRDLLDREPRHDPEEHDVGLIGGQEGDDAADRLLTGQGRLHLAGRVVGARQLEGAVVPVAFGRREAPGAGPAGAGPVVVDEAAVGDGEHPGAEGGLVAGERRQGPGDGQPGLGGEVLGVVAGPAPEVAGHRRVEPPVEDRDGPLPAVLGGGEDPLELLPEGMSSGGRGQPSLQP